MRAAILAVRFVFLGWAVNHHLLHRDSRGALGGAQLFVLGIFGEYLGRLAMQSQGRPLFIIEEICGVAPLPDRAS